MSSKEATALLFKYTICKIFFLVVLNEKWVVPPLSHLANYLFIFWYPYALFLLHYIFFFCFVIFYILDLTRSNPNILYLIFKDELHLLVGSYLDDVLRGLCHHRLLILFSMWNNRQAFPFPWLRMSHFPETESN